jgi:hypothetical protein
MERRYKAPQSPECVSTEEGKSGFGCGRRWRVGLSVAKVGRGGREGMGERQEKHLCDLRIPHSDQGIGDGVEDKVVDILIVIAVVIQGVVQTSKDGKSRTYLGIFSFRLEKFRI